MIEAEGDTACGHGCKSNQSGSGPSVNVVAGPERTGTGVFRTVAGLASLAPEALGHSVGWQGTTNHHDEPAEPAEHMPGGRGRPYWPAAGP